jgi:hypothetical protein
MGPFLYFLGVFLYFLRGKKWGQFCIFWEEKSGGNFVFFGGNFEFFGGIFVFSGLVFNFILKLSI